MKTYHGILVNCVLSQGCKICQKGQKAQNNPIPSGPSLNVIPSNVQTVYKLLNL